MAITIEEVKHIADLSNLEFSQQELEGFILQFSKILDYIEQLRQVDTEGIEPTYHAVPFKIDRQRARPDEEQASLDRNRAVSNAPDEDQGQFRVPKVIR
ncbi:MAG TPA: Asp-tRNA(Asn)/Glu-tRNA(Gln) amidotransferase subunit GatC [Acidobacteriota bacterium]|jgi:aspartyl-tRNA(Asn)/glutamyl-tRNA(Gln) amidotransferase subunit C